MAKTKKKKTFKQWVGKIHLWLGLASGLIVLLLSITGCIYVFAEEITDALRSDEIYVEQVKETSIPVSRLWTETQTMLGPDKKINSVSISRDPEKTVVFHCYEGVEDAITYFGSIKHYLSIYVDPYTGKVKGIYDEEMNFFNIVKMLHWSLLLTIPIGQQIIGWSTFIFVIMLISGIILWWPKNKSARKQRLWFQWKDTTKWRRKNYDLHNIFGFYIASIAIIIAFTGMVWAFTWFQALVYVAGSGTLTQPEIEQGKSVVTNNGDKIAAFEKAYTSALLKHKEAEGFSFSQPQDSTGVIDVYVQQYEGVYYVSHSMQFDQYTGKLLTERNQDDKNFGEKLINANYDIHVGAILGIPGKIVAFIASFICGMLPLTGFIIWWGRTNKKTAKA